MGRLRYCKILSQMHQKFSLGKYTLFDCFGVLAEWFPFMSLIFLLVCNLLVYFRLMTKTGQRSTVKIS